MANQRHMLSSADSSHSSGCAHDHLQGSGHSFDINKVTMLERVVHGLRRVSMRQRRQAST